MLPVSVLLLLPVPVRRYKYLPQDNNSDGDDLSTNFKIFFQFIILK